MSWGSDLLADARRGIRRLMARFVLSRSDAFIGDCQAVRESAIELGMAHERIVTFPWGVELKQFSPEGDGALRSQLDWQNAFVLVSTRAWEPLYGVDILVQAFLQASHQDDSLRLLLVGGGSQLALLEGMIENARAQDKVHIVERVSETELSGYYNSGDIYLSASHSDGSSVSLLEAMACGLPVLVSDIPGNREWVEKGVNGWLFPDGDVAALTQKILMLARTRDGLKTAGMHGRKNAELRADWQKNHSRLFQAYEMAIDHAGRNRA
jgi:glycosyltransferase involved in cell wall biosynthesis